MLTCRTSHAKWKVNMPKCGKYHTKWKVNMPTCRKSHAKWKVNMPKCGKYHTKWKVNMPTCSKSHAKWKVTCPNVANTMQNDKFKFQTVANTRQMVPAKKSKKNPKPAQKKILKLFHTHMIIWNMGEIVVFPAFWRVARTIVFHQILIL